MSLFRRKDSPNWHVHIRWAGYPRLQASTGTANKGLARAMERTIVVLRANGRRDIIELLAAQRLRLADVHEAHLRDPAALEQRVQAVASPLLGPLVNEWLIWLRSPGVLSPKTRRPYAASTVARYEASWEGLLAVLPRGRDGTLTDLTRGFVADYRVSRKREGCEGATINRDLCALSAFFTWLEEERELDVTRPHFRHEEESGGRERWLSAEELRSLLKARSGRMAAVLRAAGVYRAPTRRGGGEGRHTRPPVGRCAACRAPTHGAGPHPAAQDLGLGPRRADSRCASAAPRRA